MVPAKNKAKRLSLVNHTTKTIHHRENSSDYEVVDSFSVNTVRPGL